MGRRAFLWTALAVVLLGSRAFTESVDTRVFAATPARWYKVLIHGHCRDFSDGALSAAQVIKTAKKMGYAALIETDHYRSILEKDGRKPQAFEAYRRAFSSRDGLIVIAAAEIDTATAHILALGDIIYDEELLRLYGQPNVQQAVLDRLTELGLISVAAHPSLRQYVSPKAVDPRSPGNYTDMTFDWKNTRGLGGIEMLNDGEFYAETVQQYVNGVLRGEKWFITAGCDQHGAVNPALDERWTRATWVWVEGPLTEESLLEALRQGRTYAAQYGVRLAEINYLPGEDFQAVDRPVISFRLEFGRPLRQAKLIRLYRDGMAVLEGVCDAGQSSVSYTFDDKTALKGQHSYILEVKGALITSSIYLSVRGQATVSAGAEKNASERKDNGSTFPLLIGEKYNEVMGIIGEPKLPPNSSFSAFVSTRKYYPPYDLTVDFSGGRDEPRASQVRLTVYGDDPQPDWRKAEAILPQSLLEARPSSMVLFENSKRLEITWQFNGATYAIAVLDPSGQLWSRIETNGRVSYKLRGNWKAYPLKAFWQMSEKQDGLLWEMGGVAVEF